MKGGRRVFCNRSNFRFTLALEEEGMLIFHIISNFDVFGQCPVLFAACDNPRASEFCHHMHGQFCDLFLSSMRGKLRSSVFIKSVFAESLCVLFTVTDRFFVQVFYFVNVNRVVKKLRVCGYHP